MDEPPEQLYKRVEPTEPPRDERLVLGDASTPRTRFSSSNGLGDVSTALWSVILSNPEKSGLAAIHSVAKDHNPFGCGVVRSLPTGTWVPLAPSRVGGGVRVSPFGFIFHHGFTLFNTSRLLVCLDGPYRPQFGESSLRFAWGFWGIPRRVGLPRSVVVLGISGG